MDFFIDTFNLNVQTIWTILIAYIVTNLLIVFLSRNRRVDGLTLFFFGLLLTPLFSLILFLNSPRKPKRNISPKVGRECSHCGYTYFDHRTHCSVCGSELDKD